VVCVCDSMCPHQVTGWKSLCFNSMPRKMRRILPASSPSHCTVLRRAPPITVVLVWPRAFRYFECVGFYCCAPGNTRRGPKLQRTQVRQRFQNVKSRCGKWSRVRSASSYIRALSAPRICWSRAVSPWQSSRSCCTRDIPSRTAP
jgi:hypothetical protein